MKFRAHFSREVTAQATGFVDFELTAEEVAEVEREGGDLEFEVGVEGGRDYD